MVLNLVSILVRRDLEGGVSGPATEAVLYSRQKQKDKNNKISLFLSRSFLSFPFLSTRAL